LKAKVEPEHTRLGSGRTAYAVGASLWQVRQGLGWRRQPPAASEGYAAVDALVALTILAATVVFSLAALHSGRRVADSALEARAATELLRQLLDQPPFSGQKSGQDRLFTWQVITQPPVLAVGAAALCRRDAKVAARRTSRRYALSSASICPADASP
jgi:hypothetical protein